MPRRLRRARARHTHFERARTTARAACRIETTVEIPAAASVEALADSFRPRATPLGGSACLLDVAGCRNDVAARGRTRSIRWIRVLACTRCCSAAVAAAFRGDSRRADAPRSVNSMRGNFGLRAHRGPSPAPDRSRHGPCAAVLHDSLPFTHPIATEPSATREGQRTLRDRASIRWIRVLGLTRCRPAATAASDPLWVRP